MPEYAYRAMDQRRRWLRGQIRAGNEFDLDHRLRDRGLDLVACKVIKPNRGILNFSKGVGTRDLTRFCIHLEQMDRAGVPLLDSLAEARDSIDSSQLKDVITEVHRDVSEGMALSKALGVHPETFASVFTSLVAAGEETGNLTDSFEELVKHLKWTEALALKIKKATRYPMILAGTVTIAIVVMMTFVVPQVVILLKSLGQELPPETVALIALSEIFQNYWYLIVTVPFVIYGLVKLGRAVSEDFAFMTDGWMLNLPAIGMVIRKISFARFSHIFAVTFQSGLEMLDCLSAAKKLINSRPLVQSVDVVEDRVQAGESLSSAMRTAGEFPPMVVHFVKVGEDSGNLGDTLTNVAEFYDRDVDESVDAMISMIEPALIVVMGGMMAWIALAVFGPLYGNLGAIAG